MDLKGEDLRSPLIAVIGGDHVFLACSVKQVITISQELAFYQI